MGVNRTQRIIAVFALSIGGTGVGLAQSNPAEEKPRAMAEKKTEATSSPAGEETKKKGAGEGIKVHGHWTIEVKDLAGKVATHREFENSLDNGNVGGPTFLANLLLGYVVTGGFEVSLLDTPTGGGPGVLLVATSIPCTTAPYCSNTFAASPISSGLSLSGQIANAPAGNITAVASVALVCPLPGNTTPTTISPASCATLPPPGIEGFTGTELGSPPLLYPAVPVSAGQTVQATVQITFQ
jgi:hypothetical protein